MTEYPWDKIGRISWEIDRNCLCTYKKCVFMANIKETAASLQRLFS